MNGDVQQQSQRIPMIDTARFLGIVLVYYGHLVERIIYFRNAAALAQFKYIYSFHIILFFIIAGYVVKPGKVLAGFKTFFKTTLASRVIPYFFFNIIFAILTLFWTGWNIKFNLPTKMGYVKATIQTLQGLPAFNIPLWFLACLVTVELIYFCVAKFMKNNVTLLVAALFFYLTGYYITLHVDTFPFDITFWYWQEALVMTAFYLFGIFLRQMKFLQGQYSMLSLVIAVLICLTGLYFGVKLNHGPFKYVNAVWISVFNHGHIFWFPFTAILGSMAVMSIAKMIPAWKIISYLGRNTLLLFCLNGIFYHFINSLAAKWMAHHIPGNGWFVFIFSSMVTLASILSCIPLIWLFSKFLPQLTGNPFVDGPLLKRIL